MKILLLTSEFLPFHGGIGAYARELATAAAQAGHQVTLVAPGYDADQSAIDSAFPFQVIRAPGGVSDAKGLPRRILATRRLLKRERFDIVHAVDWPYFIPVRLARGMLRGAKALLTVHGTEIIYMQAPRRKRLLDLIGFWRKGWATWISNSRYTHELLLRSFPAIDEAHAYPVPLAVSDAWRSARIPRAEARQGYGLDDGDFVVASLGRIVPRKGHGVLADALALLPEPVARNLRWWVVGPAIEPDYAKTLEAKTADLPARTEFLGSLPTEDVQRRLAAADLFCLPGYQDDGGRVEGFGLVFLEAGAYAVPSVATRSGGIPEAVEDGRTGLLVAEHDAEGVAAAITRLKEDPALREEMAKAAEAKAAAATWDRVMRETYGG
ncbi:glycosyltransferase family 4 protein [Sphingomonas sp. CGMCC 1.13654]|uniref:Glycosyltransferase family 4 protein n=1 Tax=Sphingomonas chungangi TaxID=2683589 RepID=A0A838L9U7_9SPHN|nr:glycosyltransferase family 4 protein [Sphingomonas chungangi]